MKKNLLTLTIVLLVCSFSFSKPVFKSSKYYISCQYDGGKGVVYPATGEYKMGYNPNSDGKTEADSAYWNIVEINPGEYTFQNVATKKYVRHNTALGVDDRWALQLVDALYPDKSTSFTLELNQQGDLCYYVIRSMANIEKVWERRTTLRLDGVTGAEIFPVGMISGGTGVIRNFLFCNTEGQPVTDETTTSNPPLGSFSEYLDTLTFGGKAPAVDTNSKSYYLSILESQLGSDVNMSISYKAKNADHKVYINNALVTSGSNFLFSQVTGTKTFKMEIRSGATVITSGTILFTCLPLVQIYSDGTLTSSYSMGRIVVTEPENFVPSEIMLTELRTRGYFAGRQPKKSYGIKLKDTDGTTSLHRSFFGLRSDNNWVLDAMYNDPARMKNRLSTDFWLDFSTRPYYAAQEPEMVNGTRGHFVEVFLNDVYDGLYCMTEKIDRQQLQVKRFVEATATTPVIQRGSVVKADDWCDATWFGLMNDGYLSPPTNNAESWYRFDVKYPDVAEGEPFDWTNLSDAVEVVTYRSSIETFKTKVADYYDMPVFLDYYLFMELLLLTDNHGKNFFVSCYDQTVSPKISLAPWDLDSSWGRFWDGSAGDRMSPTQPFEDFIRNYVPRQSTLYKRLMRTNVWDFNDKLKSRYQNLRATYFDLNKIMQRFEKNNALFQKSGVDKREMSRWGFANMNTELSYISSWLEARLYFLDMQYLGEPFVNGLSNTSVPKISVYPNPVQDVMMVSNIQPGDLIQVFSMQGLVVAELLSEGNQAEINMSALAKGVYMVRVGEQVSKVIKN